jgi:hypothetical protein
LAKRTIDSNERTFSEVKMVGQTNTEAKKGREKEGRSYINKN